MSEEDGSTADNFSDSDSLCDSESHDWALDNDLDAVFDEEVSALAAETDRDELEAFNALENAATGQQVDAVELGRALTKSELYVAANQVKVEPEEALRYLRARLESAAGCSLDEAERDSRNLKAVAANGVYNALKASRAGGYTAEYCAQEGLGDLHDRGVACWDWICREGSRRILETAQRERAKTPVNQHVSAFVSFAEMLGTELCVLRRLSDCTDRSIATWAKYRQHCWRICSICCTRQTSLCQKCDLGMIDVSLPVAS